PVSVCVIVISTPGKTAPLWSLALPPICAVACPNTIGQDRALIKSALETQKKIRLIYPPPARESFPTELGCFVFLKSGPSLLKARGTCKGIEGKVFSNGRDLTGCAFARRLGLGRTQTAV